MVSFVEMRQMERFLARPLRLAGILLTVWLAMMPFEVGQAAPSSFLTDSWQTSEGLPHNSPTAACQAPDGYLWIATQSGIARFDGSRFEAFGQKEGLPDHRVQAVFVDSKARVWVGTHRGAAVREGGKWMVPVSDWPQISIWSIAETPDGSLWFGSEQGVLRWNRGKLERWRDGLPNRHVRMVRAAPDGSLWIVCTGGVSRWDGERIVPVASLLPWIRNREIWGIAPGPDGDWICHGEGLLLLGNEKGWRDLTVGMPHADERHVACLMTTDGSLWVATRNRGIGCYRNGEWTVLDGSSGLSHDDARQFAEDSEGNLWVCTNGGGINRVRRRRFEIYGVGEGLGRHVTTALVRDAAGELWAGTDGGGVKKWVNGRFVSSLPTDLLPDSYVWSVCASRDGGLWIGTFRHGVTSWQGGKAQRFSRNEGLQDSWVPALLEDREGRIWVGTHNGGVQTIHEGTITTHRVTPGGNGSAITKFLEDQSNALWVATEGNGLFRRVDGDWQSIENLPEGSVVGLYEDDEGRIWIGIAGGGLCLWENGKLVANWKVAHGLASDMVLQILGDSQGALWLGTDHGLQRVSVADLLEVARGKQQRLRRVEVYSRSEGLPSPQFSAGHGNLATKMPDGSLWFSHVAGAVRVLPDADSEVERPVVPLALKIESVSVGGTPLWQHESGGVERKIELEWPVEPVEVRFTAPSFVDSDNVRFRHRLVGFDEVWRDLEGRRVASFSVLPPGAYEFQIEAARAGDAWPAAPVRFSIIVKPRFWQTVGFRILLLVVGAVAVALLARWVALRRIRRRVSALEQDRKLQGERARIAQDLHDDLGATLTEINFLGVLGAAGANSPMTRERLEGIVARAQSMAKSLDEIVWTVNPTNDSLSSTVNYLCSRTQESLATADIRCRLDVAEDLPVLMLDSELRHHLLMAVNEAVNNVMKHSSATEVRLSIHLSSRKLVVKVADNGCGFDPVHVGPGRNGLENLRKRMANVKGSCSIVSATGEGCVVVLEIPVMIARSRRIPPDRVASIGG